MRRTSKTCRHLALAILHETADEHESSTAVTPLLYSGPRGRPRVEIQVEFWNFYLMTFDVIAFSVMPFRVIPFLHYAFNAFRVYLSAWCLFAWCLLAWCLSTGCRIAWSLFAQWIFLESACCHSALDWYMWNLDCLISIIVYWILL